MKLSFSWLFAMQKHQHFSEMARLEAHLRLTDLLRLGKLQLPDVDMLLYEL